MKEQSTRAIDYSVHCSYKHISGVTKGLKEFISKVTRVYVKLLNEGKLTNEDMKYIVELLQELHDILVEMQDIAWDIYKMEIGLEESNIIKLATIAGTLTAHRTKIEELLANWLRFLKNKGLSNNDLGSHFMELHEVLADIYKIEQDHIPELLTHPENKREKQTNKI